MSSDDTTVSHHHIERAKRLRLTAIGSPWPFAVANREAINRHWAERTAANPAFFDGQVFVLRALRWTEHDIDADFSLERFSSFLYWRDGGGPADGTLDGFVSALVRSAEGHVLLGRAATGTLNGGQFCLPGGFLDARDLQPDGTIDIVASAARELAEETGLAEPGVTPAPGTIGARHGRHCCFAVEFHSPLGSDDLAAQMREGLRRDLDGELTEIAIIRTVQDLARLDVLDHARFVIANVLTGTV